MTRVLTARWRCAALLLSTALASSGCVAAGIAAGPLVTAVQAVTDRTVERTVPADLAATWGASVETLERMGFKLDRVDRESDPRVIEGAADSISVTARVSRATPSLTRLAVRVEAGGITADKITAEAIVNHVLALVKGPEPQAQTEAAEAVRALNALRQEVQQLRSALERDRAGATAPASAPAPATANKPPFTVGAPAVVVPISYGFETPAHPMSVTFSPAGSDALPPVGAGATPSSGLGQSLAPPLTPVSTLAPVPGLTTPPPSR